MYFLTPFSREYGKIRSNIYNYLPVLFSDPTMQQVLKIGVRCAARRAPTLGKTLCPSLVQTTTDSQPNWLRYSGCYKCAHKICICCNYISASQTFSSSVTDISYRTKQYINCTTSHVIYLM